MVDVPLFLPAFEQTRPSQDVEMMGQCRPRDLDVRLIGGQLRERQPGYRLHVSNTERTRKK
jgi:hypothetical protein